MFLAKVSRFFKSTSASAMALIAVGITVSGTSASAGQGDSFQAVQKIVLSNIQQSQIGMLELNWKVGEQADYSIDMGFFSGTLVMKVDSETSQGFWMSQNINLGPMGRQRAEMLLDKVTGEILEYKVDGRRQDPPEAGNMEMVENREDRVTVPAGTFKCMYVKMRDTSNNQEMQAWINPGAVPIVGMLKQVSPSQLGEVTVELTGFRNL